MKTPCINLKISVQEGGGNDILLVVSHGSQMRKEKTKNIHRQTFDNLKLESRQKRLGNIMARVDKTKGWEEVSVFLSTLRKLHGRASKRIQVFYIKQLNVCEAKKPEPIRPMANSMPSSKIYGQIIPERSPNYIKQSLTKDLFLRGSFFSSCSCFFFFSLIISYSPQSISCIFFQDNK